MIERFAFLNNAYTNGKWTTESSIRRIAHAGFKGVGILADSPLIWLPDLVAHPREYSRRIKDIRKVLRESGVTVSSVNGFTASGYYGDRKMPPGQQFGPSFADARQELREYKVWYTKLVIDFAVALDCHNVSFGSGYPHEGFIFGVAMHGAEELEREIGWGQMRAAIAEAVRYAESAGVNLNLEYEPFLAIGGADDAARLLEEINSPNLGVNLDLGHSFVCGEDVVKQIHRFAGHINGVDFEDIGLDETGKPVHAHMVPGEGVMPLYEILEAFDDIGYEGWYTVELYNHFKHPVRSTIATMRALRQIEKHFNDSRAA